MEKKLSKNDAFDIRKAPEELTEEDLDMVTGGKDGYAPIIYDEDGNFLSWDL